MPIYEFRCQHCQRRTSVLVRRIGASPEVPCPSCQSHGLVRIVSSFGIGKTTAGVHAESGDPGMRNSPDYYRDPRNIGRWAERRLADMGMEVPSQVREMIDAARDGQMPDSVKDLQPGIKEL